MKQITESIVFHFFKCIICLSSAILLSMNSHAQKAFSPPENPLEVFTQKIESKTIKLDGKLEEGAWYTVPMISGFTQRDPRQGEAASVDTEVRILHDDEFLYVGAICYDDLTDLNQIRVLNMQRDFGGFSNDRFSIAIDGLKIYEMLLALK